MAKKPSLVSQELLDAAKAPKARKGDRKPTDSVQHHIDATDVLGSLKLHKPKKAYGGAVPDRIPIDKEDPEAYFRRLITWSFAVAPLFGRSAKADGGEVEGIEKAGGGRTITAAFDLLKKLAKERPDALTRAKEQGFDTKRIYFHGTDKDIPNFEPIGPGGKLGVYIARDPEIAEVYARKNEDRYGTSGANIMPLFAKKDVVTPAGFAGSGYYNVPRPSDVRSVFADFSPEHIESPDLLKSNGGEVRRHGYATDGYVSDIEAAIRAAEEVNKRQEASHEKGVSGAVEFAPVGVTEPLSGTRLPLGSLPKETAQVVEPALQAASEIAPYFTPAAPIAAARDVAVGLREGDPTNVALSALGLPGKAAKAAAIGASAFMPSEAEASPIDKALGIARRLTGTGHYSPAAEAAAALKQEKGPASQMIGGLKNLPGVKPEELKWSGIESAFQPSENVTRQQIMDYLHENLPQIKERTYGGSPAVNYEPKALLERPKGFENTDDVYEVGPQGKPPHLIAVNGDNFDVWGPSGYHNSFDSFNDAVEYANQSIHGVEPPLYGEYTTPGGKNYREVVMALPKYQGETKTQFRVTGALPDSFNSREEAESYIQQMQQMGEKNPGVAKKLAQFPMDIVEESKAVSEPYKSSHWLGIPNPLGHLRMSDRTGSEGEKILHLEELQSDWGQAGRKRGFNLSREEKQELKDLKYVNNPTPEQEARIAELSPLTEYDTVPRAPYITNTQSWTDLGLKRALREAAEGGYDKMIWTPGAEQAARYDLSKHIDELHWNAGNLVAYDPNGRKVIQRTGMSKEELPDLIGKEAAERLLAQEADKGGWRYLDSEGLKVGGEGMQSFYDKIVPTQLSKLIKKLDPKAKIEMGSHNLKGKEGEDINAHALHITPELRKRILEGLPAYAEGGAVGDQESPGFVDRALNLVSQFNPVGTAEAGPLSTIARAAKAGAKLPPVPLEQAMERVVSPFSQDPDKVRQAIELARDLRIQQEVSGPKSDYYLVGQSRAPKDVTTKIEPIPNLPLKTTNPMTWEDFYNTAKDATFINLGGDRSNFGRLTHINDQELAWPIDLHAGAKYMLEPSPGAVWANAPGPATGFKKAVSQAAKEGDVYGIYTPMGPTAVDSSHNMFDALMAQIPNQKISKEAAEDFDEAIKSGSHWGKPEEKKKAAELLENWPGISNPKAASEFARQLPGGHRRAIVQYMDSKPWRDKGFPMVGETRVAITDPELRGAPKSMMGHRVVKFNPQNITPETSFEHSTYPVATGGEYVGDVPLALRHYVMPEALENIVTQPAKDKSIIHPFSIDPRGRSSARKFFEEQKMLQGINQRFLDSVMQEQERRQKYGLKKGGSVISDALDVVSSLPK